MLLAQKLTLLSSQCPSGPSLVFIKPRCSFSSRACSKVTTYTIGMIKRSMIKTCGVYYIKFLIQDHSLEHRLKILHWKRNFEVYFFANFVSKVTISLKLRKFFRACGPCSAAEL